MKEYLEIGLIIVGYGLFCYIVGIIVGMEI